MLDLGALEKAQTAIDPIWHTGVKECRFHHPALRVAAVEQRDFLTLRSVPHQLFDLINKPVGFGKVTGGLVHAHRFPRPGLRAQIFPQALAVVADQLISRIQDIAEAAVIALQLDLVRDLKLANKISHVTHASTAKGINALVVITNGHHRAARHWMATSGPIGTLPGQHLDPGVLQLVGVLKFIDQDVAKAPLVVLGYLRVVPQQLVAAQHQLAEIDDPFTLALLFIKRINFYFLAHFIVAYRYIFGTLAVFLAASKKVHQLFGGEAFIVDVELLAKPLDARQLILRIQNLKSRRQIDQLVMGAQKTVAQPMEGANPHATYVDWQHGRQPHQHFLGGLVGKRDRQNARWRDLAGLQEPGDAGGQHPGLARARSGQYQRMGGGQGDGCQLLWIKILQERGV